MPFTFKHTLIMEGLGHGASESWYFQMPTASLDLAFTQVADIKNKRAKLLGKEAYLKGERIALVVDDAGVKVTNKVRTGKFYLAGNQAQPAEESNVSLQCLAMDAEQDNRKLVFLFAPWRSIFPGGDSYDPSGTTWLTFFNQWAAAVKNAGMGWMGVTTLEEKKITNYVFDPLTGRTTYTLEAPGLTWPSTIDPQKVSVSFPVIKSPLDGVQMVIANSATSCTTTQPAPAFPFMLAGKMRRLGLGFVGLNVPAGPVLQGSIEAQNPVSRKRGRPLLVSRGRAQVRPRM